MYSERVNYYLLSREKKTGALDVREFSVSGEALEALRLAEASAGAEYEVVLFLSPDLRTLEATHPRFFPGAMQRLLERAS